MQVEIEAFWAWWPSAREMLAKAARTGTLTDDASEALNDRVAAIHPKLAWELPKKVSPPYQLWLTGRGDLLLRALAGQWCARAPVDADDWAFYPARPALTDLGDRAPQVAGRSWRLGDITVGLREDEIREVLDVILYHPDFADLEETSRAQLAFVALDAALGEDGVERWIGLVTTSPTPPTAAVPLAELPLTTAEMSQRASGERWVVLRGRVDRKPLIVTINRAIKSIDYLSLDAHIRIDVELRRPNDRGLARSDEAVELNDLEEDLLRQLRDHAVRIARETHRGHRVVHLHAAEHGPAVAIIDSWRRSTNRNVGMLVHPDPRWAILHRWG